MTANNSTNNNLVFFFASDLKVVYYNNDKSSIRLPWTRVEKYFTSLLILRQNHTKFNTHNLTGILTLTIIP